jgi:hypothetical protein
MAKSEDETAHELDTILNSYDNNERQTTINEEQEQDFLAKFERIKVETIKPTMEEIGKYLERKGHSYRIEDNAGMRRDNPSIRMEVYPRMPTGDHLQDHEFPTIAFIAEPDVATVGIEVTDGMPGRPGLARGHSTELESLTKEYVQNQIVTMLRLNFTRRPRKS